MLLKERTFSGKEDRRYEKTIKTTILSILVVQAAAVGCPPTLLVYAQRWHSSVKVSNTPL